VNASSLPVLKNEIRKFVIDTFLFGSDEGMADETSFLANGIIDSTGVLELVAHLETTYRVKVKDHELIPENLDSINAIAEFLEKNRPSRLDRRSARALLWIIASSILDGMPCWFGIFSNRVPTGSPRKLP